MKQSLPALFLILSGLLLFGCEADNAPREKQQTRTASYRADPDRFDARGGKGRISGILTIRDDKGAVAEERSLNPDEYTLQIKEGAGRGITIDNADKSFTIAPSTGAETVFVLKIVTRIDGIPEQEVSVHRAAYKTTLSASYRAEPDRFDARGGKGRITGILTVRDDSGTIAEERSLNPDEYTLQIKEGAGRGITIDNADKSFTIAPSTGAETVFVLKVATRIDGIPEQEVAIHRAACEASRPAPNPLSFVAEYNVAPDGAALVASHDNNVSGYFDYDGAHGRFRDITIQGKRYHIPSWGELLSIMPDHGEGRDAGRILFGRSESFDNLGEKVEIQGVEIVSTNDYRSPGHGVCYALRYKGTDYRSAWRYEYADNPAGGKMLRITARMLPDGQTTVNDLTDEAFWNKNTEQDAVRIFPASGLRVNGEVLSAGTGGAFWSGSMNQPGAGPKGAYYMGFSDLHAFVILGLESYLPYEFNVRLFLTE